MARDPNEDDYWPLGGLSYASEIHDFFPEEAELLGAIAILWSRQELALKRLFVRILASKRSDFGAAIWDRQPTHQARRDLLALALHTVKLTKRQRVYLEYIIDKTKVVADRRNELLHADYVVQHRTQKLHAKVRSPRSTKPPKYQPASTDELKRALSELESLLQISEGAWLDFLTRKEKRVQRSLAKLAEHLERQRGSPQSDSAPPSPHQTRGEE